MMQVGGFARMGAKKIGLILTMAPMFIETWIGRTRPIKEGVVTMSVHPLM